MNLDQRALLPDCFTVARTIRTSPERKRRDGLEDPVACAPGLCAEPICCQVKREVSAMMKGLCTRVELTMRSGRECLQVTVSLDEEATAFGSIPTDDTAFEKVRCKLSDLGLKLGGTLQAASTPTQKCKYWTLAKLSPNT